MFLFLSPSLCLSLKGHEIKGVFFNRGLARAITFYIITKGFIHWRHSNSTINFLLQNDFNWILQRDVIPWKCNCTIVTFKCGNWLSGKAVASDFKCLWFGSHPTILGNKIEWIIQQGWDAKEHKIVSKMKYFGFGIICF